MEIKRATPGEREAMRDVVLKAIANDTWAAIDAGEVLVAIAAAMMKASGASEEIFLAYCQKVWAAQQPKVSN
mgnify:CR=1 FL=1